MQMHAGRGDFVPVAQRGRDRRARSGSHGCFRSRRAGSSRATSMPWTGWRQRISPSAPASVLRAQVDLRLVPQLQPALASASSRPTTVSGRSRSRCALVTMCADRVGAERLLSGGRMLSPCRAPMRRTSSSSVDIAAAHQLHDAAIAALAEPANDVDRVGLLQRDVEKDDRGDPPVERRDRVLRGVEFLRRDAHGGERHRDQFADAVLVVDDECVRRRRSAWSGASGRQRDVFAAVGRPKPVTQREASAGCLLELNAPRAWRHHRSARNMGFLRHGHYTIRCGDFLPAA